MIGDTAGGSTSFGATGADRSLNALLDDAEDRLDKAKEVVGRAQDAFLRAKDGAAAGVEKAGDFARERPYVAMALSAVAGLILGHLMAAQRPTVVVVRGSHLSHH